MDLGEASTKSPENSQREENSELIQTLHSMFDATCVLLDDTIELCKKLALSGGPTIPGLAGMMELQEILAAIRLLKELYKELGISDEDAMPMLAGMGEQVYL